MKIAIYGAGAYGKAFLYALKKKSIKVDCFIDQHTLNKEYLDLPVYRMKEINQKDIEIYISVALVDLNSIPNALKNNGFINIYSFVESIKKIDTILPSLMKTNILWMREHNSNFIDDTKVRFLKKLLSDDKSKQVLSDIINFRKTLDTNYYIMPDLTIQYFPDDINLFNKIDKLKLVDCGAFTGDTIKSAVDYMRKETIDIDFIVSFEPDLKNLEALNKEIKIQKQIYPKTNFIVYPAGIWSENKILKFSNDGSSASSICSENDENDNLIEISAFSLDSTLTGLEPNYIKMDIEGAEQEALLGGAKMIKKNSPILAICLYHKPADLWEIPLLINEINPNYDMYIRIYGHLGLETILYCLPKDLKDE